MTKKTSHNKPESSTQKKDKTKPVHDAHWQAEHDIAEDADLSIHSPNDDLDEAELARLGGDKNDLV